MRRANTTILSFSKFRQQLRCRSTLNASYKLVQTRDYNNTHHQPQNISEHNNNIHLPAQTTTVIPMNKTLNITTAISTMMTTLTITMTTLRSRYSHKTITTTTSFLSKQRHSSLQPCNFKEDDYYHKHNNQASNDRHRDFENSHDNNHHHKHKKHHDATAATNMTKTDDNHQRMTTTTIITIIAKYNHPH